MSEDEESTIPAREAAFTETMQMGFVLRDLKATIRRYEDDYGIGPWGISETNPVHAPVSSTTASTSSSDDIPCRRSGDRLLLASAIIVPAGSGLGRTALQD